MADDKSAAGAGDPPEGEGGPSQRPLKRWRVVVRGTAAALVRESPREDQSEGTGRGPSWKGRLGERRGTA